MQEEGDGSNLGHVLRLTEAIIAAVSSWPQWLVLCLDDIIYLFILPLFIVCVCVNGVVYAPM